MTARVQHWVGYNISTGLHLKPVLKPETCIRITSFSFSRGITCSVWQLTVVKTIFEVTLCSIHECNIDCRKEEDFVRTWFCSCLASWSHFQLQEKFVLIPLQVVLVPYDQLSFRSLAKFTQCGVPTNIKCGFNDLLCSGFFFIIN